MAITTSVDVLAGRLSPVRRRGHPRVPPDPTPHVSQFWLIGGGPGGRVCDGGRTVFIFIGRMVGPALTSEPARHAVLAVAKLAEVQLGEAVLNLGCGTGTLPQALVAASPVPVSPGIDPDRQVRGIARRRLLRTPTVELVEGYAQDLPFPDRPSTS